MKTLVKILCLCLFSFSFGQDLEWSKIFNGQDSSEGYSVQQTTDGGYIVTGYKERSDSGRDIWLIKTDENGNEEWNKIFVDDDSSSSTGFSVEQTIDGGYIIGGGQSGNSWLIKTDENGDEEWNQVLNGSLGHIQQTSDGGYIIGGSVSSNLDDFLLIKTDENGIEEWRKVFGGSDYDRGKSVQQTIDNGYVIVGYTESFGNGDKDIWLIKTDENGNEEWNQIFGGDQDDVGYSVEQTTDGGYIITGYSESFGWETEVYLIKTDQSGNQEWNRVFGTSSYDEGYSVQQTTDGGYIITGFTWINWGTFQNLWLIKTDEFGYEEWNRSYGGSGTDWGQSVKQTLDGGYIVTGLTLGHDLWLLKIESSNDDLSNSNNVVEFSLNKPYPNPFNPTTTISFSVPNYDFVSIRVYDINGGLVSTLVEDHFNQGNHSLTWDGTGLSSGQYLVKMESGSFSKTQIISLVK